MKLYIRNKLILEICGDDTLKSLIINILYGLKYFIQDLPKFKNVRVELLRDEESGS